MPQIDIVIVNWNSGDQLQECLASVAATVPREILGRVVVVDNASTDNSLEELEQTSLPLLVVRNPTNRGFAAACNQGAAAGSAEHLLFLNPDTRLHVDSLSIPLAFLAETAQADVGICGIQLLDDYGRVARSCSRLPTAAGLVFQAFGLGRLSPRRFPTQSMTEWDHATTRAVDQVMGAFFLMRREAFQRLGRFDERFYVYFEEVDLSLRARAAGWRTVYLADAQAFHRGGGTSEHAKARRLFYSRQSRILYAAKHFSTPGALAVAAATLLVEPWIRLAWATARLAPREIGETIKGFALLWMNVPSILRQCRRRGDATRLAAASKQVDEFWVARPEERRAWLPGKTRPSLRSGACHPSDVPSAAKPVGHCPSNTH
jgi:N-acetylglucosaminyl-diphospho-decaprenol L-rhamnosyltransferase